MDSTHLLNAYELHALAPGILRVVHGPDGTHGGAPPWRGPLYGPAYGYTPGWWYFEGFDDDGDFLLLGDAGAALDMLSYDLRVESVQARFVRLCVQTDPMVGRTDAVSLLETGTPEHGFIILAGFKLAGADVRWIWNRSTGNPIVQPDGISLPPRCDKASALRALVLALAPKIVALGGA